MNTHIDRKPAVMSRGRSGREWGGRPCRPLRRLETLLGLLALSSLLACGGAGPTAAPERIRSFGPADQPIAESGVTAEEGGWKIVRTEAGTVPLFELSGLTLEEVRLAYRARLKTENVLGKAYLEMWVRVPGVGEAFSRGLDQPLTGSSDWASHEIPFFLKKGEKADLVKLGVAFEGGGGTVWIRDVELTKSPLPN